MPTVKNFEELDCWKESRKIVHQVYELTKKAKVSKGLWTTRPDSKSISFCYD